MASDLTAPGPILSAAGPVTAFGEAVATSVGAGMVLGGFVAGLLGVVFRWNRVEREKAVVAFGSFAGLLMVAGLATETLLH